MFQSKQFLFNYRDQIMQDLHKIEDHIIIYQYELKQQSDTVATTR